MYAILNEIPANNCVAIIVSSDEVDSQKISIPHIVEYFDDIDKKIFGRSMTSEQASRYAQFITELDESVCHIYCCFQSAQSRSAAVASALYKYYGDDKTAYSIWEDPMYSPNPYVFMLLCEALGVNLMHLLKQIGRLLERQFNTHEIKHSSICWSISISYLGQTNFFGSRTEEKCGLFYH